MLLAIKYCEKPRIGLNKISKPLKDCGSGKEKEKFSEPEQKEKKKKNRERERDKCH